MGLMGILRNQYSSFVFIYISLTFFIINRTFVGVHKNFQKLGNNWLLEIKPVRKLKMTLCKQYYSMQRRVHEKDKKIRRPYLL
ncbi:hypothetical protein COJ96_26385 [Bacillus sp. AFS073361]|nr:hypothetical protein COJ96_26385 [Bacillus sp. AFS073361]